MYCPKCQAEFREGFHRCEKCDVDLIEGIPAAPSAVPPGGRPLFSTLRTFKVEDWLKLGAFIYVAVEILGALMGRSGIFILKAEIYGGWGAALVSFTGSALSAIIQGALYYGVGEIIGLLRRWAVHGGGE